MASSSWVTGLLASALTIAPAAFAPSNVHAQAPSQGSLAVARIFASGMVVQRETPIPLWGIAPAGTSVMARFKGRTVRAIASSSGTWRVEFPASAAGGPFTFEVEGGGTRISIGDVLVGDVWVASGQSNMEWRLVEALDGAAEIAAARDSALRQFKVPHAWSWRSERDVTGGSWSVANPAQAGDFTAVGYFFGKDLRAATRVPIAIINDTWSGSSIEAWLSREALALSDSAWAAQQRQEVAYQQGRVETLRARLGTIPSIDSGLVAGVARWADPQLDDVAWSKIAVPSPWERQGYPGMDGVAWYRTSFDLGPTETTSAVTLSLATIDDADITWVNGVEVGRTSSYDIVRQYQVPASALRAGRNVVAIRVNDGGGNGGIIGRPDQVFVEVAAQRRALANEWLFKVGVVSLADDGQRVNKIPAGLYNAMAHPLLGFPIRGVIWYQGESNANNDAQALAYRDQFATLIRSWRREWRARDRDFPFLWVQLPNYGRVDSVPPEHAGWALLRESQAAALALPRTGQAVTIDVGDPLDLHPKNKKDVGKRLALLARRVAYGDSVTATGPVYRSQRVADNRIVVSFEGAVGGLRTSGGSSNVTGFAIAGPDRRFVWASARISGNQVEVWSDRVSNPVAVRYAWGNSPPGPNLMNGVSLPAAPFRTDSW